MRCGQEHQGIARERCVVHDSTFKRRRRAYIEIEGGHVIQFIVYSGPVLLRSNWKDSKNEGRDRHTHVWLKKEKEKERGFSNGSYIGKSPAAAASALHIKRPHQQSLCFSRISRRLGPESNTHPILVVLSCLFFFFFPVPFRQSLRAQSNWNIRTEVLMEPNSTGNIPCI